MKIIFKATLLFLMVFMLMVFVISCSKNYDDTTFIGTGDSTIKGKVVTSAEPPEAIGGAIVALNDIDKATTATDGTYVVTGVGKGTYTITATLGSSVGSTVYLVDSVGNTYEDVNISIQQSTSSTGKIIGRVVDATTGNGINNVIVKVEEMDVTTLSISGATASSDTDIVAAYGASPAGDGYYILQNIDVGNFKVSFTKQGYFSNMKRLTVSSAAVIDAGTAYLSYDLSSAGMIVGHVTDAVGNVVAGATVSLDTGATTVTNTSGDYKIENLPERIYDPDVPEPG
ncbi:carboxypeptidase regulatory-like domain-containing protein, partial [bacterium]|nr:carboxypeptidase regulatory-like domain-containing protein [bacterium]